MKTDPASRRARNVVALVVVTVALPSLVLTALGVAAIRNEEIATKRRTEKLYRPLLGEVANEFNLRFDEMLAKAKPALTDLLAWSRDPDHDLTLYRRFIDRHPSATNLFILDGEGTALTPNYKGSASSCCVSSVCFNIEDFRPQGSSGHDATIKHRRYGPASKQGGRVCSPARRAAQIENLLSTDCFGSVKADPETIRLAKLLFLESLPETYAERARFIDQAASLAARLADPTRRINPSWAQKIALALMYRFEQLPSDERRWASSIVALQSQRKALIEGLSRIARTRTNETVIAGLEIEDMRRLVVLVHDGDRTAGFEIAPTPFYRDFDRMLMERDLNAQIEAHVGPLITADWWDGFVFPEIARLDQDKLEDKVITWIPEQPK